MPHAATCRACAAVSFTISHTRLLQNQAQALQPVAAHAQQAARLLVKPRALEGQRCGNALLGRCLHHARLETRLVHLGTLLNQQGMAHAHAHAHAHAKTSLPSLRLNTVSLCPMLPHPHGACSRLDHRLAHAPSAEASQISAALPHDSMSCTCLLNSARSSASAAAKRCSAAASASARASARAWSIWAEPLN